MTLLAPSSLIAAVLLSVATASAAPAAPTQPFAALGTAPAPDSALAQAPASPESPRASLAAFLDLARQRRYALAARYLPAPPVDSTAAGERARRLRVILEQRLAIDLAQLSPSALGDTTDGSPDFDRVGVLVGEDGRPWPVRLERRAGPGLTEWVFDSLTVARVDEWYSALPDARYRQWMPASLLEEGPGPLYRWQWIGLLIVCLVAASIAAVLALTAKWLLAMLVARTETHWDDLVVERLRSPFRLWLVGMLFGPLTSFLALNARADELVDATVRGVVIAALFWGALRLVTLVQSQLLGGPWAMAQPQARTLVPLVARLTRVTIGFTALLVVLSQFGYPVTTLLAGLGIGGIALALAAQKTVENLFGSVSLAADRVFHVGDYVRIGDMEGTVERIGLRTTSFRTRARTVVRIPNGKLAEERIETFGERDRFLFEHFFSISSDTPRDVLQTITAAIETRLRAEPSIWTESVVVRLVAFGEASVTLRAFCWFTLTEFTDFLAVQERILYDIQQLIVQAGANLALPSRRIFHVSEGGSPTAATVAHGPPAVDG